jgi:enamine deaminase RidA (YjgF/YER057c/UK114 family)
MAGGGFTMIERISGNFKGRCRAVVNNGTVYAVATDTTSAKSISEQTRRALETLENNLIDAGSGKSGLLQATVYLKDMSMKAAMDEVWCVWIGGEENWPQRACVGADLAGDDLIEIVVTAAIL